MSRIKLTHTFNGIISVENLLEAWQEFVRGKSKRTDVQEFQIHLMQNIFSLYRDLKSKTYIHGGYEAFNISDPKPRHIHKATVRDRLLHHAMYRILCPFFDRVFIADSYSCRLNKGTHKAMDRFKIFARRVSKNNTKTCWVLKCDIKKFFASIDQQILKEILTRHIKDEDITWLLNQVISSFSTEEGKGLPLGNLTSQLLVNIYMNELDQFMKHKIKAKYYVRYADDFVILSTDKRELARKLRCIATFLREELGLNLHSNKVSIETLASGVDFLGWVHFPTHRVLRTVTKRRMFTKLENRDIEIGGDDAILSSYVGLLGHGDAYRLQQRILWCK